MKRAFTLIELLVVIAIIAILAAILFPVFAQAKLAAKKTQGLAQMKQIGTASQLYMSDNDDGLPTWNMGLVPPYLCGGAAIPPGFPPANERYWDSLLLPYVKNGTPGTPSAGVWQSPGAEYASSVGRSIVINQLLIWDVNLACVSNAPAADNSESTGVYIWPTGNIIETPSSTIFVGDGGPDGRMEPFYFFNGWADKWVNRVNPVRSAPWRYGNEGANYVFTDTSAKYLRGDLIYPNPGRTNVTLASITNTHRAQTRCSAAKWQAPTQANKDHIRSFALSRYGVTCPAD